VHALVTRGVRLPAPVAQDAVPDLEVEARGVAVLHAPNGTDMSAFIELCGGTVQAARGAVRVMGLDPSDPRVVRSRSICRRAIALAPRASVAEHVALFAHAAGVDHEPFLERFAEHGPLRWLDAPTERLSPGMARLAWIVLTTTPRRALTVLHEPFLGLDDAASSVLHDELEAWGLAGAVLIVDQGHARAWSPDVRRIVAQVVA
jgi:ABC-type multidrug transport system ATPase subunit